MPCLDGPSAAHRLGRHVTARPGPPKFWRARLKMKSESCGRMAILATGHTMIIRSIAARSSERLAALQTPLHSVAANHPRRPGSRSLARSTSRPLRRLLSTHADSIDASSENSLKQLQSLEAQLNSHLQQPVPSVDPQTHATSPSVTDNVAEQYHVYKQQGEHQSPPGISHPS